MGRKLSALCVGIFLARFCVLISSSLWWPQKHSQKLKFFWGECPPDSPTVLCATCTANYTLHTCTAISTLCTPLFYLWIRHCIPMHRRVMASGMMSSYMYLYRNVVRQSSWKISVWYHQMAATVDITAMYGATCLCCNCFKYSVFCMLPPATSQYKNVPNLFTY